jgi:hypothetical protein
MASNVKLIRECFAVITPSSIGATKLYSCDNKNPISLGIPAVDRRTKANSWQQRTFNGHVIEVTVPTCKKSLEPHPDIDLWDSFFNAPVSEKKAECWKTLREKLTLLMKHCDKRGRF